ncbi:MAG: lamin tail domain-containing protein, partial [Actinobacteria bacterium]|nr:lamin tail domain-containing protein [Actinomycetota bacterium]
MKRTSRAPRDRLSSGLSGWLPVLVLLCGDPWLGAQVVINEIFYNEPGDAEDGEFIELLNASTQAVDLDGWELTDGVRFEFPQGEVLEPGELLVVAASRDRLAASRPSARITGEYEGRLSNSGETLIVLDRQGRPVDTVTYSDGEDWPQAADGSGASLELIDPGAPRDFPGNWAAGEPPTPGAPNGAGDSLPTIAYDVEVSPEAVTSGDAVTVRAHVFSEAPIERVLLRLTVGEQVVEQAMADDGLSPDESARDGEHTAEVRPFPDRTFVKFKVIAVDQDGTEHAFPKGDDERDHYAWFVHDGGIEASSPIVWLFLSPEKIRILDANAQVRSTSDPRYANFDQTFDAFVVLEGRVHRKVAVRHRGGFASRHAGRLKYSWRFEFPDWDRYHGRRAMLIIGNQHWDDPFIRGDNGLRDKLCYMTFDR